MPTNETIEPNAHPRGFYMVFVKSMNTGISKDRRKAIAFANKHPGAEVRAVSKDYFTEGGKFGFDVPTFRVSSTLIYRS